MGERACLDSQRTGDGRLTEQPSAAPPRLTGPERLRVMEIFDTLTGLAPAAREARLAKLDLDPRLADRLRAMLAAESGEECSMLA